MLPWRLLQVLLLLTLVVGAPQRRRQQRPRGKQGRARLRGRVRSTTTTTTTTTPLPIYEEEYDDYEQYEEYNYNDGSEEEDEGWEKAREMLEEEVPARYGEQGYGQHEYVFLDNGRRQGEHEEEEQQGHGQEGRYEQTGYGYGGNSQEVGERWNEGRGSAVKEEEEEEEEEGACGPDCRNRAHELDHPQEAQRCPYEGMVIDVYGYCRYPSHSTGRDWLWWATMRQYIASGGNSGVW